MPNPIYTRQDTCRLCGSASLSTVLDLGEHYLTAFIEPGTPDPPKAPLELMECSACHLVQLHHTVHPSLLYQGNYPYQSGLNSTMRDHLTNLAWKLEREAHLDKGDVVLSIGVNDGTEMDGYTQVGLQKVGFEPAPNLIPLAEAKGIKVIQDYFSYGAWYSAMGDTKAKAISAVAMFYDVPNPRVFCEDMAQILHPDGVAVIQMNDLEGMVEHNAFDIIGHEHLCYWDEGILASVLVRAGLTIYDLQRFGLNGGTGRYWIARHWRPFTEELDAESSSSGLPSEFSSNIATAIGRIRHAVESCVNRGESVYLLGASTRGNTILQACGLTKEMIQGAAEIHPDKIGKVIGGLGIPIVSEEEAKKKATVFLVLPYSYKVQFIAQFTPWLKEDAGRRLIFPLPQIDTITRDDLDE